MAVWAQEAPSKRNSRSLTVSRPRPGAHGQRRGLPSCGACCSGGECVTCERGSAMEQHNKTVLVRCAGGFEMSALACSAQR